jgi:hypothetical protein
MADSNRNTSTGSNDWDDDGTEYEVEPPDPDVLAAEDRRAEEIIAASQLAVDLQKIEDEAEGSDREYLDELVRSARFRFRTKHLLVAMTVVAVLIAMAVQGAFGPFFVLAMLFVVGGTMALLSWKQHQRELELARRRQEVYARQRAVQQTAIRPGRESLSTGRADAIAEPPVEKDSRPLQRAEPAKLRLRFTLAEMMVTAICTAVLFGLIGTWGLAVTATLVGLVALGGLVLHALGFEPPHAVVFGWWVLLLLYIVLSIVAAIWEGL